MLNQSGQNERGRTTRRAATAALLLLVVAVACAGTRRPPGDATRSTDSIARFELFVLGIAQDGGLPHLGCSRVCCARARRTGRELYPASLGIHDRESGSLLLIEATPAIEKQVALLHAWSGVEPRPRRPFEALLLTHAHIGHYTGLIHLGREVAATRSVPVYATPRMSGFLEDNGPWSQLVELDQIRLERVEPGRPFEPLPGLEVTAIAVEHRQEYSDTVAYRIRGPRRSVLFLPDIDRWPREGLEGWIETVDVAYLDGTFFDDRELPGRDVSTIPHPRIADTMDRLQERAESAPGSIRFIHLNHTNPALHDGALRESIEARGFRVAERGERVAL